MARILITGSSDGLGLGAARLLASQHHDVVLHARNQARAADAGLALPEALRCRRGRSHDYRRHARGRAGCQRQGPFRRRRSTTRPSDRANRAGSSPRTASATSLPSTSWLPTSSRPRSRCRSRLIYLSSGMHHGGQARLDDPQWEHRRWSGSQAYSDSKLFVAVLAAARRPSLRRRPVERRRPWLGGDEDGRSGRTRRPRPGFCHPGLAGRGR